MRNIISLFLQLSGGKIEKKKKKEKEKEKNIALFTSIVPCNCVFILFYHFEFSFYIIHVDFLVHLIFLLILSACLF